MPAEQYVSRLPRTWWLQKRTYFFFMVRELSSLFVLGYAVFLLVLVARAGDAASFEDLYASLQSPVSVVLHVIVLALVLFHTVTWIALTPKVLVLWRGEDRINPRLIAAANYVAWLILSVLVAWVALR